ncbi:MAG TPA: tetratricopeptide repeat protein [Vicinamibacterales bacterium]|nr:tetratricopeptide repeat protein [Vicinamibacterales bacterium]
MTKPALVAASNHLPEKDVRQQLDRILGSPTFQQVDRLKRFLTFVTLEAVAGRSDQLKEYVIGVQVFSKEQSFDPRTDPIVRVQARRLRARLVRYYREEGQNDEIVIELPKGGYAPTFKRRAAGGMPRRSLGATLVSRNTVSVLPFADHSANGDLDYFCRGLRQEIVDSLAKVEGLRVLAWDASDPRSSDAAMIVAGSVRAAGRTTRISIQLIDGATGCYLWSESLNTNLDDPLTAQENAARTIVGRLQSEVANEGGVGRRRPTENLAAHNLYLQGRYYLNQRTEEALRKAVDFFEKAIVEDAQYALAYSGLSDAFSLLGHYGVFGPADVWTKTTSSAASAVMLDGNSVEAHTSLAHVKSTQDWDWSGAEREFQRAISLDPRYPTAHHWYAMSCLAPMGRLDEALDEMLLAQSLDPVSSIIVRDVAVIHFYRRDFDAALDQCDHTIELNPHFSLAYLTLGFIQEQRKDFDESAAAFQRAIHLSPQTPRMHAALARTLALSGKRKAALEILRKLEALAKGRYVSPFEFAVIQFALGHTDLGFNWLTKACQDRAFELLTIKVDPRFDPLKDDRRFESVVRQMGLE